MRTIIYWTFILIFISCTSDPKVDSKDSNTEIEDVLPQKKDSVYPTMNELCSKIFISDSGYILKNDAVHFLLAIGMTDTSTDNSGKGPFWNRRKITDTLGKYYLSAESDHYLMCLVDYGKTDGWETHVLSEYEKGNDNWKLIAKERYSHGNYPSCWPNIFDGFKKYGNLFSISNCGTGSCFSSTHMQFFNAVVKQDWKNSLCTNIFQCGEEFGNDQKLDSKMIISNKTIYLNYFYKEGKKDSIKVKYNFSVNYSLENGMLKIKDSVSVKKYNEKIAPAFFEL
jgi:hypothetical protein